jgi:hypothetical protein
LENLPAEAYLGFDINPKYVEAAQSNSAAAGGFFAAMSACRN